MNENDIKRKMMKLWKDTFHDSDAYISLIFDNYFNPDYIEYHEENGQIISALIGIPYDFGNDNNTIKGIYLCGLATKEEFRHKGIMNELINKINKKALENNIVISFLIPASDLLRIYYHGKGYVNGMYRVEERYTDVHDFDKDCQMILNKEDEKIRQQRIKFYNKINVNKYSDKGSEIIEKISEYIQRKERENKTYFTLLHSIEDIKNIIKENQISGGEIFIAYAPDESIIGVAFTTLNDRKRLIIPKIYYDNQYVYYKLLDKAKNVFSDSPISILRYPEEINRQVLWSKVYGASDSEGLMTGGAYGIAERVFDVSAHAQPYGMVKILNVNEILKILAKDRVDADFSILVKDNLHSSNNGILFKIKDGDVSSEDIAPELTKKLTNSRSCTVITHHDLAEILFRKKDSNSLIMEAFGIPRISLNMALLLD